MHHIGHEGPARHLVGLRNEIAVVGCQSERQRKTVGGMLRSVCVSVFGGISSRLVEAIEEGRVLGGGRSGRDAKVREHAYQDVRVTP